MMYLLLVIGLNTIIFSVFKLFGRYGINTLQAVTVNYWVCVATGAVTHGGYLCPCMADEPWFVSGLILGAYFIFLFNFMAYSTRTQGMTITTVANKLSLVIPVAFSYWLYSEPIGWLKLAGIALALPAVYMATRQQDGLQPRQLAVPIGIFIASGLSDTAIKYIQHTRLKDTIDHSSFTILTFAVAAAIGTLLVGYMLVTGKSRLAWKNIVAGIILGIPNYFSIYYLIRLLDTDIMPSSSIIPVNNVGIVVSTSLVAILLFREKAGLARIAGIVLSVLAIVLIAVS